MMTLGAGVLALAGWYAFQRFHNDLGALDRVITGAMRRPCC